MKRKHRVAVYSSPSVLQGQKGRFASTQFAKTDESDRQLMNLTDSWWIWLMNLTDSWWLWPTAVAVYSSPSVSPLRGKEGVLPTHRSRNQTNLSGSWWIRLTADEYDRKPLLDNWCPSCFVLLRVVTVQRYGDQLSLSRHRQCQSYSQGRSDRSDETDVRERERGRHARTHARSHTHTHTLTRCHFMNYQAHYSQSLQGFRWFFIFYIF